MDGAMGPEEEVVEAVLTCEGDFHDPELLTQIEKFRHRLKDLLLTEKRKLQVKKIEPWNSVKVTFTIPREAAIRLRQLAQTGNDTLKQMGVLSVQIQGDSQISLTIAGRNSEPTELVLRTPAGIGGSVPASASETGVPVLDVAGTSSSSSSDEVTRKNIVDYLTQGSALRPNPAFFGASPAVQVSGMGLGIPQPSGPFPNLPNSSLSTRPMNMTASNPVLGGSQNSSFPFIKTPGAFHTPIPRLPFSAGQSSAPNPAHHMHTSVNSHRQEMSSAQPGLSSSGQMHVGTTSNANSFNVVSPRLSPSMNANMNNVLVYVPPPPSPPGGFMMDLPPPPPYPHASSTSRPGKPVTASSPLLVNLLQTDPLSAEAGMASGNPNKAMTDGDSNSNGPPPKKKRRPRKPKDSTTTKSVPSGDLVSNNIGYLNHLLNPVSTSTGSTPMSFDGSTTPVGSSNATGIIDSSSAEPLRSQAGTSHISEPGFCSLHPENKSPFSSDRPFNESRLENPASTGLKLSDSVTSSAIGARHVRPPNSKSNGPDTDPFTKEIAAGKIINPYTGQLEPRDSILDSGQGRLKEAPVMPQENSATQALAKKARELEEISKKSVPVSFSQVLDINVVRSIPITNNVSTSTAAFVCSGGSDMPSDKLLSSIPSHRRMLISDRPVSESVTISSFYSTTPSSWQSPLSNSAPTVSSLPHSFTSSLPVRVSTNVNSSAHNNYTPLPPGLNGPLSGVQMLRHGLTPSQHSATQHATNPSYASGAVSAPSGSVIFSSVTMSPSSSSLPQSLTHHSTFPSSQIGQQSSYSQISSVSVSPRSPSTLHSTSIKSPSVPISSSSEQLKRISSKHQAVVQSQDQLKSSESSNIPFPSQQTEAANSGMSGHQAKLNSPTLLNSLPEKHMDSQSSSESPPDKVSSEGDDNSNHSGMATDTLTDNTGTSALLEHSGVKSENQDSGIGSSSERSDDTPSEPGDGEFRPASTQETEDSSTKVAQKENKLDPKLENSSNTITVGYILNPSEGLPQPKLTYSKDTAPVVKTTVVSVQSSSDISQFLDSHLSTEKRSELMSTIQQGSPTNWSAEGGKLLNSTHAGKAKMNGPIPSEVKTSADSAKNSASELKVNGPSQVNIEKMIMAMSEIHQKKLRPSKHNKGQGLGEVPAVSPEHMKLQAEVLEKMAKYQQLAATSKDPGPGLGKSNDGLDSPDSLTQRLATGEERHEGLSLFEIEDLVVNGKLLGNGAAGVEGKGSNITSIYSKRSSPVNVNMLNHIYAPGLPLPRRLTESVQRLVKPLPTSESSLPQVRPCKSPSTSSPRAGAAGVNGPNSSRVAFQSGARSPGASMPKLIPNDKHSLLSGGLDLAGFTSLQHAASHITDQIALGSITVKCSGSTLPSEVFSKELLHSASSVEMSPPDIFDSTRSHKMLSQSFPPHKSRDFAGSGALRSRELFMNLQAHNSESKSGSLTIDNQYLQHQFAASKNELENVPALDSKMTSGMSSCGQSIQSNASSMAPQGNHSSLDSANAQTRLFAPTASENSAQMDEPFSHSNSASVEASHRSLPAHSNAHSPVMPSLHRGPEQPASNVPPAPTSISLSSSQTLLVSSANYASEISLSNGSTTANSLNPVKVSAPNRYVPYNIGSLNNTSASTSSGISLKTPEPANSLPLSSVVTLGGTENSVLQSGSISSPPKLFKSNHPSDLSSVLPRSGSYPSSHSRNLFESVSGTLTQNFSMMPLNEQGNTRLTYASSVNNPHESASKNSDSLDQFRSNFPSKVSVKVNMFGEEQEQNLGRNSDVKGPSLTVSQGDKSKAASPSKYLQASELPMPSSPATEVVNLDYSVSLNYSEASSVQTAAQSESSLKGETFRLQSTPEVSASNNSSTVNHIQEVVPNVRSTSSLTLTSSTANTTSVSVDFVTETIASVAAGLDEPPMKAVSLPNSFPVKEPILKTIASALGSSLASTAEKSQLSKSFIENRRPINFMSNVETVKQSEDREQGMVSIQSTRQKESESLQPEINTSLLRLQGQESGAESSESASRRVTRKRKMPNCEDSKGSESDASSESIPVKNSRLDDSLSKSPSLPPLENHSQKHSEDGGGPKVQLPSVKSSQHLKSDQSQENKSDPEKTEKDGQAVHAGIGLLPVESKDEEVNKPNRNLPTEEKDSSQKDVKPLKGDTLSSGESVKEVRPQRTIGSIEGKEAPSKEGRPHRSTMNCHDKEKQHRSGSSEERERLHKDMRPSKAPLTNSEDKEAHSKDSVLKDKALRVASNSIENNQKDGKALQASIAPEGLEKMQVNKDVAGALDAKAGADSKSEDGGRRGHRIKRQFYAYVPEKSIDQRVLRSSSRRKPAYFDTPILSSRTRSRNKTTDSSNSESSTHNDEIFSTTGMDSQSSVQVPSANTHVVSTKSDAGADSVGSKRSTRSHRSKDSAQDQSTSKRRRGQQRDHR